MRKKRGKENKASCHPLVRPASVFSVGNKWSKSSPFSQRPSFKFALPPSLPKIRPPLPGNSTSEVVLFFSEVAATTSEVVSTALRARTHYTMQRAFCFHGLHPRAISSPSALSRKTCKHKPPLFFGEGSSAFAFTRNPLNDNTISQEVKD